MSENTELCSEVLIETVKQHQILYDPAHPEYKNIRKKDKEWNKMGKTFGVSGEELKKKWKNIRDGYGKHLRMSRASTDQSASKYNRTYQWALQMEYYRPYLAFSKSTLSNVETTSTIASKEEIQERKEVALPQDANGLAESCSDDLNGSSSSKGERRKNTSEKEFSTPAIDKLITYLKNKNSKKETDPTDLLMLSLGRKISSFSPKRRIGITKEITNIVLDEELRQSEGIPYGSDLV